MITVQYVAPSSRTSYLFEQAKLRGLGPEVVLRRLLDTILEDKMIGAVLDDAEATVVETREPEPTVLVRRAKWGRVGTRERERQIRVILAEKGELWLGDLCASETGRNVWAGVLRGMEARGELIKTPGGGAGRGRRTYYRLQSPQHPSPCASETAEVGSSATRPDEPIDLPDFLGTTAECPEEVDTH